MIKKLINSSIGINAIKKGVSIVSGVVFLVLMSRYLGTSLRGEFAFIINTINIIAIVLNLGISLVLPNYLREKKEFGISDFISLSIYQFLLNLFLAAGVYLLTGDTIYGIIFLGSALSIFNIQVTNITLVTNIKLNAIAYIISAVVNVVLIVVTYFWLDVNLYYVLGIYAIKELIVIILGLAGTPFRFYRFKPGWFRIIKAGFLPMLTTMLIVVNYRLDVVMLEAYKVDFALIGLFATGVSLAEYSWLVPDIFKEVMLNKNTKRDEIELTNVSLRMAFSFVLAFAVLFLICGKFVLGLLFGQEYVPSYSVTASMFLAVPFMVFAKIIGTLFITQSRWKLYFAILAVTVLLNIGLNALLIPYYDIYGAALASIVSYAFCGMACLGWYARKYELPFFSLFIVNKDDLKMMLSYLKK